MVHPQRTCSHMELLPLVCLCLLSCSGTTSADPAGTVVVEKGSDVILPCSNNGVNLETESFDWTKGQMKVFSYAVGQHSNKGKTGQAEQFKGRVSHFEEELKHGNASIKITNARMADSGDYTCDFPGVYPPRKSDVKLVVGAAPEPYVTSLDATENSALLQCEAHGVPHLEVHWQDSDGNKLPAEDPQVTERGGLSYITLKTTVTKKGNFFCVATQKNLSHRISAEIFVPLPRTVVVKQDDDGILPCSYDGVNIETKVFDWKKDGQPKKEVFLYNNGDVYRKGKTGQAEQFRGRVSHFKDELEHGNASIKITNATMADSGDYTCEFPRDPSLKTVHVKLVVARVLKDRTGENIPGAAPEPCVKTVVQTETSALLQCEAHGVPDLEVHWQDSDGNKLPAEEPQVTERGGLSYITLKTTVTKTDNFSCVATQKNISHRISSEINIKIDEPDTTGWIVAVVFIILFVAYGAVVGVVLYKRIQKYMRVFPWWICAVVVVLGILLFPLGAVVLVVLYVLKQKHKSGSRQHKGSSPEDPAKGSELT